jgi:hypothetical protein
VELISVIQKVFDQPPIPHEPAKQSLKAWAMYCLRDRGFKVVYAQNADFAIEPRTGDKVYFKVTTNPDDLDSTTGWIVWDSATQQTRVVLPPA